MSAVCHKAMWKTANMWKTVPLNLLANATCDRNLTLQPYHHSTVKYGDDYRGCFSSSVTGKLNSNDGKMDGAKYNQSKPLTVCKRLKTAVEVQLPAGQHP